MKRRNQMLSFSALVLFCLATPSHAQMLSPDRTDAVVDEVAAFERDVDDAATTEQLSRKDASYLRGRARAIRSFFNKISKDGLSLAEAQLMRDRIGYLRTRYSLQNSLLASQ